MSHPLLTALKKTYILLGASFKVILDKSGSGTIERAAAMTMVVRRRGHETLSSARVRR
jgi:hypothetical protein